MKKSNVNIKEINRLRSLFPSQILVRVHRSDAGDFCAEVTTFPGCFTEADTFSELIEMINDAVRTYFEIPRKYFSFMPEYLPPIKMAQDFNAFPVIEKTKELKFQNVNA
ncbi:MAG: hypothetical protein AAB877_02715 [Patescibacteria group bacterium]